MGRFIGRVFDIYLYRLVLSLSVSLTVLFSITCFQLPPMLILALWIGVFLSLFYGFTAVKTLTQKRE